jgi:hypothetical protein
MVFLGQFKQRFGMAAGDGVDGFVLVQGAGKSD